MSKKVFLSAKKDSFWLDVVNRMKSSNFDVCYWIGAEYVKSDIDDVFFHEVVDAYELKNCYPLEIKRSFNIN
ncbi:hypothetical protein, partial [Salinivibrio sharmensis]